MTLQKEGKGVGRFFHRRLCKEAGWSLNNIKKSAQVTREGNLTRSLRFLSLSLLCSYKPVNHYSLANSIQCKVQITCKGSLWQHFHVNLFVTSIANPGTWRLLLCTKAWAFFPEDFLMRQRWKNYNIIIIDWIPFSSISLKTPVCLSISCVASETPTCTFPTSY